MIFHCSAFETNHRVMAKYFSGIFLVSILIYFNSFLIGNKDISGDNNNPIWEPLSDREKMIAQWGCLVGCSDPVDCVTGYDNGCSLLKSGICTNGKRENLTQTVENCNKGGFDRCERTVHKNGCYRITTCIKIGSNCVWDNPDTKGDYYTCTNSTNK